MGISVLWKAPEVNPVNQKARSIPALNPINPYGRVFLFSWFGFFIAFWAWYAFPPLLSQVIAGDVFPSPAYTADARRNIVLNSNIVGLAATLGVRLVAGPSCDRFGPRNTFAALLILGAIPSFCSGGIRSEGGLYAVRFFVGILGGSFVPCQVWTTAFFDKNTVGFANALTGGIGNAGGGVTYFVMPAVFTSLVSDGLTPDTAWRVAFVVPSVIILTTGIVMILICPETPTGKWSERQNAIEANLRKHNVDIVDIPGQISTKKESLSDGSASPDHDGEKKTNVATTSDSAVFEKGESHLTTQQMLETAKGETIKKPTLKEILLLGTSPQVLALVSAYFVSFGAELAINSMLGTWYGQKFGNNVQRNGNWAAMFGLLNVVFRPLGGLVSDFAYKMTGGSLWAKKIILHSYCIIQGVFLLAIGLTDPTSPSTLYGLIAGMAFFLEGANGLNFGLVPHVHPHANGIVSGYTGAAGNFGGIIFAIIFRFVHPYAKAFWVIGIFSIALNLLVCWIPPIPKGQIGGR